MARELPSCAASSGASGLDGFWCRAPTDNKTVSAASEERLAWLTGSPARQARCRFGRPRGAVCRWALHGAGECSGRREDFSIEHLVEHPPEQWLEQNLSRERKLLTPGFTQRTSRTMGKLAPAPVQNWSRSKQSGDTLWRDRLLRLRAPYLYANSSSPAKLRLISSSVYAPNSKTAWTRCWCPIRKMSLGLSTSVVRT